MLPKFKYGLQKPEVANDIKWMEDVMKIVIQQRNSSIIQT